MCTRVVYDFGVELYLDDFSVAGLAAAHSLIGGVFEGSSGIAWLYSADSSESL